MTINGARSARLAVALTAALAMAACSRTVKDAGDNGGLNGGINNSGLAAPGSTKDFVANVGDRVFFDTDSVQFTPADINTLNKQAAWLSRYSQYHFTIEGHADERGTREYNFQLGASRAQNVKTYLISRGISASRMNTISYGKERPVATCNNISCWSQNRRAVIVLHTGGRS
ncbi:MAG: peptidoglycan-associated lipoprotein Pal [Hyphomicrobiales bacterium]|nr:peptidoglycan-associated lipoprotein Pal [Hyphomicrobiales bacterium]